MTEERKKHYWLHRISGGENATKLSYPLLFQHKILSIGWSYLAAECDHFLADVKYENWTAFEKYFVKGKPRSRHCLWRFINKMKKGDIVVVPTWKKFHIYKIADDNILTIADLDVSLLKAKGGETITVHDDGYLYDENNQYLDLGFFRKVEELQIDIPRHEYANQKLYSRLKAFQTNVSLQDIREEVEEARQRKHSNNPINIYNELQKATIEQAKITINKYTQHRSFEELVEKYLRAIGAKIEDSSIEKTPTDEGDADRVAILDNMKLKIYVQIKKHGGVTSKQAVSQVMLYSENHTEEEYLTINWVISSGESFSDEAQKEAKEHGILLINGSEFARMILDVGLKHFE